MKTERKHKKINRVMPIWNDTPCCSDKLHKLFKNRKFVYLGTSNAYINF